MRATSTRSLTQHRRAEAHDISHEREQRAALEVLLANLHVHVRERQPLELPPRIAEPAIGDDRRSALLDQAGGRRRRVRVVAPRHPPGEERLAPGLDRRAASPRPSAPAASRPAMPVFISTAVQPSSIATAASLAVPTPASTITGTFDVLEDDPQVVRVADAEPRADRRRERHHRGAAGVLELLARSIGIVGAVRQDHEALLDQHACAASSVASLSGNSVFGVADDLELDELVHAELAREAAACAPPRRRCSSRRCWAGARTSCDRARRAARLLALELHAAQRDGDDLGARRRERARGSRRRAYLPVPTMSATSEACGLRASTVVLAASCQPPPTKVTARRGRRPRGRVAACCARGTTSRLRSTATRRSPKPSSAIERGDRGPSAIARRLSVDDDVDDAQALARRLGATRPDVDAIATRCDDHDIRAVVVHEV